MAVFPKALAIGAIFSLFVHAYVHVPSRKPESTRSRSRTSGVCGTSELPRVFRKDGHPAYYEWLTEDVRYAISDAERSAFKMLQSDQERDNFIEAFWRRRDPTPDTIENEFKDQHYSRIVYANQRFAARLPGSRTDRGRIYVRYGPPDSIESTTLGAIKEGGAQSLGNDAATPVEVWHYRYMKGVGRDETVEFVEDAGDFHTMISLAEANVIMGDPCRDSLVLCTEEDRKKYGPESEPVIQQIIVLDNPPKVRFKDLEEVVTSKVRYNLLPFKVQTTVVRATEYSDWTSLTLQFQKRDLSWKDNDEKPSVNLHVFARFLTMTGRIAAILEDEIKTSDNGSTADGILQFSRSLALPAGRYRLDLAVHDTNADKIGTWSGGVILPGFYSDDLHTSPIIFADHIDSPHRFPNSGELFIGAVRIRPRLAPSSDAPVVFNQGEELNLFLQAYGVAINPSTGKSDAMITYKLVSVNDGKSAVDIQESSADLKQTEEQITLQKSLPLSAVPKGEYHLCVTVNDRIAHRSSASDASVVVD